MKQSVKFVHLIHAHPLEKMGDVSVYPPQAFYRLSRHLTVIKNCIGGGANNIQIFHADTEAARRAGAGSLFTAFGKMSVEISQSLGLADFGRLIDDDTSLLIIVCELKQLSALTYALCGASDITPPNFSIQEFPNGGMIEVDLERKEAHLSVGD